MVSFRCRSRCFDDKGLLFVEVACGNSVQRAPRSLSTCIAHTLHQQPVCSNLRMASASIPACLYSQIPVFHPAHLEGDSAFATEILPGPPSLESLQQDARKSDSKPLPPKNYLPLSVCQKLSGVLLCYSLIQDPGTTYSGLAGGMAALANASPDGKRKRARLARTYVPPPFVLFHLS